MFDCILRVFIWVALIYFVSLEVVGVAGLCGIGPWATKKDSEGDIY